MDVPGDGRWISQAVANSAVDFLQATADLLHEQPFIYSSNNGDLVAEFSANRGTLTAVASPSSVLLFAVVDGVPIERRFDDIRLLRDAVLGIRPLLSALHGDLATKG
jgi:hypothetical protein